MASRGATIRGHTELLSIVCIEMKKKSFINKIEIEFHLI